MEKLIQTAKDNFSSMTETAKENLSFIIISLGIIVAIFLVALIAQKVVCKGTPKRKGAKYIVFIAMFSAISGVLMTIEIPLFFAPGFYKLDLSEIPVLLCSFYMGPVAGVITEFLKVLIKLILKNTSSAFVGDFANFVIGCSFVLPASIIYYVKKTKKTAIIGMITGTLVLAVFGSAFNALYLLPKFAALYGMPLDAIVAMGTEVNPSINSVSTLVLFAVLPFNLLKGIIDSLITFLLYKRLERVLLKNK